MATNLGFVSMSEQRRIEMTLQGQEPSQLVSMLTRLRDKGHAETPVARAIVAELERRGVQVVEA